MVKENCQIPGSDFCSEPAAVDTIRDRIYKHQSEL